MSVSRPDRTAATIATTTYAEVVRIQQELGFKAGRRVTVAETMEAIVRVANNHVSELMKELS